MSLDSESHYITNVLLGNEYVMGGEGFFVKCMY